MNVYPSLSSSKEKKITFFNFFTVLCSRVCVLMSMQVHLRESVCVSIVQMHVCVHTCVRV